MNLLVPKIIVMVLVVVATIARWTLTGRRAKRTEMDGLHLVPPPRRTQVLAAVVLVGVVVFAVH